MKKGALLNVRLLSCELVTKIIKLETDLQDREEKAKIFAYIMAELRAAQVSLAKLTEEKKSADDRVAELEA
ncbi:hypothetical protein A2U01_0087350, partial [Trifolium medium]|nr:hypothetical protein [Trifolium medium]